jgi:hypothetical protein
MTWEEAKDQIAKEQGFNSFKECLGLLNIRSSIVLGYLDKAADLYAKSKWDEAVELAIR